MSNKIKIEEILMEQFVAAGDTQYMNGNTGINAKYIVNRRWLNNFAKLLIEAVVDECESKARVILKEDGETKKVKSGKADIDYLSETSGNFSFKLDKDSILQVKQMIDFS